jgi:hypothetical protein
MKMKEADFKKIESEDAFVQLLKEHDLYREDDVTFDDVGAYNMHVYTGDDFVVDRALFEALELGSLLVVGSVRADSFRVSDILNDYGVFCVTGSLRCRDMLYMTESTGVGIGKDLVIENVFYSDCGNSGLQVNGNLDAKVFYNFQCAVEVRGTQTVQLDREASADDLRAFGLAVTDGERPNETLMRYFEAGNYSQT